MRKEKDFEQVVLEKLYVDKEEKHKKEHWSHSILKNCFKMNNKAKLKIWNKNVSVRK